MTISEPRITVFSDYKSMCGEIAAAVAQLVREKPDAVLGLPTGNTPLGVYAELVRMHREDGLDFSRITTFNLDEYYPIAPDAPQSYWRFMRENLFDHINCVNYHVPDGRPRDDQQVAADCLAYEQAIEAAGGLDLQLLGIGRNGHIGFNEPGSPRDAPTRLMTLSYVTRSDAAHDFFGIENVPVRAVTMGVGTILKARRIIFIASGARKAGIVQEAVEGKITSKVPASFLREHPATTWYLDAAAASSLKGYAAPWLAPDADFSNPLLQRRTLISIAQRLEKPLQALSSGDFAAAGIAAAAAATLVEAVPGVEQGLRRQLSDADRLPSSKAVLCLSPHPDDDVICCGATLLKMAAAGNSLTVAYGVSGSVAVRDKDVLAMLRARHARFVSYLEQHAPPDKTVDDILAEIRQFIFERERGQPDSPLLDQLKRILREGEAADACRKMGARPLFLNLPFYQTRKVAKNPITEADVAMMLAALQKVQPELVLQTGELADPHGTHAMCRQAFALAAEQYLSSGGRPFELWTYRGAWEEYPVWEGDYFSVFDQSLMERKVGLILNHISQLDPLYPGATDPREFYERARDRNRATARQLQQLGVLPPSRSFDPVYVEVFRIIE